ncbi:MAG: T9SS type A sorting domain-containing protein [Candidatus Marinimicrobia bacterium]|nr:T9SS type A sorting domain-containing protein [Candidatus Neomarinimicrobiota bacterium]
MKKRPFRLIFLLISFSFCMAQIEVSVFTDKSNYIVDENIEITVSAYNPTAEPITLNWPDACQYDVFIDGQPNIGCVMVPSQLTIESLSTYAWAFTYHELLDIGNHEIIGLVVNYGEPDTTIINVRDGDGYFPLDVGNEWVYRIDYDYDLYIHTQAITGTDSDSSGNLFSIFNTFDTGFGFSFLPTHFRWEDGQIWGWFGPYYDSVEINGTGELNYPIFKFDAAVNQYWNVTLLTDLDSVSIHQTSMSLQSKTDTVITEVGTFENCFHFLISFPYGDGYSFWFAEDVGLVKRHDYYEGSPSVDWILQATHVSTEPEPAVLPSTIKLYPAYPNPFNPIATIRFNIPVETRHAVSLQIYDITGRVVKTLLNDLIETGIHEIKWNASGFSSGIYFVRLESEDVFETQKIVMMK